MLVNGQRVVVVPARFLQRPAVYEPSCCRTLAPFLSAWTLGMGSSVLRVGSGQGPTQTVAMARAQYRRLRFVQSILGKRPAAKAKRVTGQRHVTKLRRVLPHPHVHHTPGSWVKLSPPLTPLLSRGEPPYGSFGSISHEHTACCTHPTAITVYEHFTVSPFFGSVLERNTARRNHAARLPSGNAAL